MTMLAHRLQLGSDRHPGQDGMHEKLTINVVF